MPQAKGRMAHNLRLASWRRPTPASFNAAPLGTYPRGGGFSLLLFFTSDTLAKAVEWLPVPSHVERAYKSENAVTFLRMALRHATHTLFSCSRYYESILLRWVKSGNARAKAHTRLTAWVETAAACGGLKPVSFKRGGVRVVSLLPGPAGGM